MRRSPNNPSEHPTALITGGSKGIGLELARQFAREGHPLVLVAREETTLKEAADRLISDYGCVVRTISSDLAVDGAPTELFRRLNEMGIEVDILVNNVGVADFGPFASSNMAKLSEMLHLNMVSLSLLTRLFLPGMINRGAGRILNVASVVAFFAGAPNWAAYVASKQYVLGLTRGLRSELRGTGVSMTALCPGPAATAFIGRSGVGNTRAYRWLPKVHPSAVARAAYKGTMAGRRYIIPGLLNKINAFLGELPPRGIAQAVLSFLLAPGPGPVSKEERANERR